MKKITFPMQKPVRRNTVASATKTTMQDIITPDMLEHAANCVMVDTIGIVLDGVTATSLPKRFTSLDDSNTPIFESEWGKGALVSGTGKQSILVRATKSKIKPEDGSMLQRVAAEGSPAGHRQGHNIVSCANVPALVYDMLRSIAGRYGLDVSTYTKLAVARGCEVEISRIDPGFMLNCPVGVQKSAVINGLAIAGIRAGCNIGLYHDQTVYFDQNSQLHAAKLYDKYIEWSRKKHKSPTDNANFQHLIDLMNRTIRFESVFRKKYFLNHAKFKGLPIHPLLLTPKRLATMVLGELAKYNLRGSLQGFMNEDELYAVPAPYRTTLALFQHGRNLRKFFDSDRTYHQHRRFLLQNYSVDIAGEPPGEISFPIEIGEILDPRNFARVPDAVLSDPALFFQEDMTPTIQRLKDVVGGGISAAFVDPYELYEDCFDLL